MLNGNAPTTVYARSARFSLKCHPLFEDAPFARNHDLSKEVSLGVLREGVRQHGPSIDPSDPSIHLAHLLFDQGDVDRGASVFTL